MIAEFLERYGIQLAIEPAARNPMGPDSWQDHFNHYAVWFRTNVAQMPFYVSIQGQCPPTDVIMQQIARIFYLTLSAESPDQIYSNLGLPETADSEFYALQIFDKVRAFEQVLTPEGFGELLQIGAQA